MPADNPPDLRATTILACCPYFHGTWTIGWQNKILHEIMIGDHASEIENWWDKLTPNQKADVIEFQKKSIQLEIERLQKEIGPLDDEIKKLRG